MTKAVIDDGETMWAADWDALVKAMNDAGWKLARRLGSVARIEPDGDSYAALCRSVPPAKIAEGEIVVTLAYYPAENAWLWDRCRD